MEDLSHLLEQAEPEKTQEENWVDISNQLKHYEHVFRSQISPMNNEDTNNLLVTTMNYLRFSSENVLELRRILKKK